MTADELLDNIKTLTTDELLDQVIEQVNKGNKGLAFVCVKQIRANMSDLVLENRILNNEIIALGINDALDQFCSIEGITREDL